MGRYLTKMMFLVLLLHLLISSSSGSSVNSNESGADRLEFKDLSLCKVFHGKTCCSVSQMQTASLAVENRETAKDFLDLFELLDCSICHPYVGIQSRPFASFCDRVFEACSDAYLSSDANNQVMVPCGASKGIICGEASRWESNGTSLWDPLSFTVQPADDSAKEPCYTSNATLKPMIPSLVETGNWELFKDYRGSFGKITEARLVPFLEPIHFALLEQSVQTANDSTLEQESSEKTQNFAWFQDFQKQVFKKTLVMTITRVLVSVVLDAFLISRRRQQLQRLRLQNLHQHARRL